MAWNWGVPGVRVRVPNTRNPIPALPMNWDSLAFDPLSAYDLRRHLGVPSQEGVYMDAQRNFVSGELAHLAAGARRRPASHRPEHLLCGVRQAA